MRIKHVVVTPFNNRLSDVFCHSLEEAWLRQRWKLLEAIMLPSLAGQTCTDFEWLILLHPESPRWLKKRAASLTDLPFEARSLLVRGFERESADLGGLEHLADPKLDAVLTTRLDSDDALSRRALASVRESFESDPWGQEVLNFEVGYQLDCAQRRLTLTRFTSPPFATIIRRPPIEAVFNIAGRHTSLPQRYKYRAIMEGDPMYIRSIHDANVSSNLIQKPRLLSKRLSALILRAAFNIEVKSLPVAPAAQERPRA